MRSFNGRTMSVVVCVLVFAFAALCCSCGGDEQGAESIDGDTDMPASETDIENSTDGDNAIPDGDAESSEESESSDASEDEAESEIEPTACEVNQDCPEDFFCENTLLACEAVECEIDADCAGYQEDSEYEYRCGFHEVEMPPDGNDLKCRPKACWSNAECSAGYGCNGGICSHVTVPDCRYDMYIEQTYSIIQEGEQRQLNLLFFNENGVRLLIDIDVTWESDNSDIVAVSSEGIITGGSSDGTAEITAAAVACPQNTASIEIRNSHFPPGDFNVWLINNQNYSPVGGAKVLLNGVEAISDESGLANYPGVDCTEGCDIHVFDSRYNYFSALGIVTDSNLVIVPLTVPENKSSAAGVKGSVDLEPLPDIIEQKEMHLALTLLSYSGSLTDISFLTVGGLPISQYIQSTGLESPFTMPSGLQMFFNGTEILTHKGYRAQGKAGKRIPYAFTAGASSEMLISTDSGNCAEEMTGYYRNVLASAYHGISDTIELDELPYVADSSDINGDGSTDDLVPDYYSFTDLGDDLASTQAQSQSVEMLLGNLPAHSGTPSGCAQAVHLVAGFRHPEAGFVYLGYAPYNDNEDCAEEGGDCKAGENNDGSVVLNFAPQHSGQYGYIYYYIATATPQAADMLPYPEDASPDRSVVLSRSESSEFQIAMPEFEPWLESTTWNAETLELSIGADIESQAVRRLTVLNTGNMLRLQKWEIYFSPVQGGFTLEERPVNFVPGEAYIDSIRTGQTLSELLEGFGEATLFTLDDVMEAYSRHYLETL